MEKTMKPPTRADKPDWDNDGFIHWDTNPLSGRVKFAVQGVLYLTDTAEDGGGFSSSSAERMPWASSLAKTFGRAMFGCLSSAPSTFSSARFIPKHAMYASGVPLHAAVELEGDTLQR